MEQLKTLKQYAKEAMKRLKSGFWENYQKNLDEKLISAENMGVSTSKVKEYYSQKVIGTIKNSKDEDEEFYNKVKSILDTEGQISNPIGRLTDKTVYDALSYDEKQRYNLSLSERYLKALERYEKEKTFDNSVSYGVK